MILILMLLITAPHIEYLPLGSVLCILILALWRALIFVKKKYRPGKLLSVSLTLLAVALIYQHANGFSGITAGSHLLIVMSFFKLLESHSSRDYMLLVILSFFIISTNFLFSQTLFTAFYMFICLFFTLLTLLTINQKSSDIKLTEKSAISLRLIAYSLPIMIVLFLFFPRITGPLWKTKTDQTQAKTGLTDSMEPGEISKLVYSNELVFRTSFKSDIPPPQQRYWRAIILWNFDGRKWSINTVNEPETSIEIEKAGYEYTVTLEPNNKKWLYLLDLPYQIQDKYNIDPDFTARANQPVNALLQYTASASQNYRITSALDQSIREIALTTPGFNTQAKQLALSWKQQSTKPEFIVNSALNYFSKQGFYYTLSPAKLTRQDGIDQFLFENRQGFCEHYASAFAILMRSAGIPTRIVLGYLGGSLNPLNNVISVDQSMAHAWNEVWIDGKGWIRIDPTAAIAPDRINIDINSALKDQTNLPLHIQLNFPVLLKIKQLFSAIDNNWNQWVLSYDKNKQQDFLKYLTGKEFSLKEISELFIQILLLTLTIISLLYFYRNTKKKQDPVNHIYNRFLKKLERAGYKKAINEGPRDFKRRLQKSLPKQQQEISFIIEHYIKLKFKPSTEDNSIQRLTQAVRQFNVKKNRN